MSNSYQQGHVHARMTKTRGLVHDIAYRVKQGDGKWKLITETIHTRFRKEAKEEVRKRLDEINGGKMPSSDITFSAFITDYWAKHVAEMKPSTQKSHASVTKHHLLPKLGGLKLKEIAPPRLATLLGKECESSDLTVTVSDKRSKKTKKLSDKSRLNVYLLLAAMFAYAISQKLIAVSPLSPRDRPKVQRKEKPTLKPSEVWAVIAAIPLPLRALFVVLTMTGCRIGEVLGLKWKDVDLQTERLFIRRSVWNGKEQSPKSKNSVRSKPLVGILAKALAMHRVLSEYKQPGDFIFASGAGRPLNPDDLRKRVLYPAMDKAGITRSAREYGFHLFRHSSGSVMSDATGNLKTASNFLGHASISTTADIYLHESVDVERAAMEKLETAMFPTGSFENLLGNVCKTPVGMN
jgi:integrase